MGSCRFQRTPSCVFSVRFGCKLPHLCWRAHIPMTHNNNYRPQEIDEAARRRLSARIYIPLPDTVGRSEFLKRKATNNSLHPLSVFVIFIGIQGHSWYSPRPPLFFYKKMGGTERQKHWISMLTCALFMTSPHSFRYDERGKLWSERRRHQNNGRKDGRIFWIRLEGLVQKRRRVSLH